MSRIGQLREYRQWSSLVRRQTGKSLARQLIEIAQLRKAGGRCGISDYYWYRIYDEKYQQGRGAADYLGWRLQQEFSLALNPRHGVLPASDKTVFFRLAEGSGLPVAPILATYSKATRLPSAMGMHLRRPEDVAAFLRETDQYPLFAKPAFSQQGYGTACLLGHDPSSDGLRLQNGKIIPLTEFLVRLDKPVDPRFHRPECGFLFQPALRLHPAIEELTQWPAICGVRIVCLNDANGVKPIRAIWKIAVPPNHVDNFSLGKYGNLVADIDLTTGEISRPIDGLWPKAQLHDKHPYSGQSLAGFILPGWKEILSACSLAGEVFPLMKVHHWDFAITDTGPKMLELNDLGATEFLQLHGHGLLTEETREFLKRHADAKAHPWVAAL